jgi:glycine cleavage system H protein
MEMKPEELKYNPSHEWVGLTEENGEKIAVVGISDFAVEQLTDLVYMALPSVGQQVKAGREFGEVESVKAVSPLYSPIDGEVVAVHSQLADNLEKLGEDPFGDGWIIKVRMADGATLDGLMDYAAYRKQCAQA